MWLAAPVSPKHLILKHYSEYKKRIIGYIENKSNKNETRFKSKTLRGTTIKRTKE